MGKGGEAAGGRREREGKICLLCVPSSGQGASPVPRGVECTVGDRGRLAGDSVAGKDVARCELVAFEVFLHI